MEASTQLSVQSVPKTLSPRLRLVLGKSLFAEIDVGHWGGHGTSQGE